MFLKGGGGKIDVGGTETELYTYLSGLQEVVSGFPLAVDISLVWWENAKREGSWDVSCISCLWAWLHWDMFGRNLIIASFDGQFSCAS